MTPVSVPAVCLPTFAFEITNPIKETIMAQEKKTTEEEVKPHARKNAGAEQNGELLLVRNRDDPKSGLRVVSGTDENGHIQTVPANARNENSFLKFDKNSSILENFIRNFWSQLKEPTHFHLLQMSVKDYKENKQTLKDWMADKLTDMVKDFLKAHEVHADENGKQQSTNPKENVNMAENEAQAGQAGQEQQEYRYDEAMIDWKSLEAVGVSKEMLKQMNLLEDMLKGYKTNRLIPLNINVPGLVKGRVDARLSFATDENGQVVLAMSGVRQKKELDRPYFGHNFSEEDKKMLRETGNLGRTVELLLPGNPSYEPCLVSMDLETNELSCVMQSQIYIPNEICGVTLDKQEIEKLKNGEGVLVEGMRSAKGKEFDATLQYSATRRGLEFIFPENNLENIRKINGAELTPNQMKLLSEGRPFLLEDMKRRDGSLYSAYIVPNLETQQFTLSRVHPETKEVLIPKEIGNVLLTPEDTQTLKNGGAVFLENMISKSGEEFSRFVRINQNTGMVEYSKTPDGFQERTVPVIPQQVYGHKFTAKERAALQEGKSVYIPNLKGAGGKEFARYIKPSSTGQLNYYMTDPDVKRDTSQRASQKENAQSQNINQKRGVAV